MNKLQVMKLNQVIKKKTIDKSSGPDDFIGESYPKKLTSILLKLFQRLEEEGGT